MQAVFRLRQIVGGFPHLAEVEVTVEAAGRNDAVVSADAFDWRQVAYGPAWGGNGSGDQLLITEALEGVWYALARLPVHGPGYRVDVTRIRDAPVDTSIGDVKLAAALAVCAALGVQLDPAPRIEAPGAVFPG